MTRRITRRRLLQRTITAVAIGCLLLLAAVAPAAASTTTLPASVSAAQMLNRGDRGPEVRALQERLVQLRYFVGRVDGIYGYLTQQAVLAFQKVNGLRRDGAVGAATRAALRNPMRPQARTTAAVALEVVKDTQVLLLARNGQVRRIFNASTGKPSTPTPSGRYRISRQINGWHTSPLGQMYRPKYFSGGYAIHGSLSVPAYAASHGCVRLNTASADFLWTRAPVGTRVLIYSAQRA